MAASDIAPRRLSSAIIFLLIFAGVAALHIPLLRLPYFWDEAGYYVPAAHDLLLTGSLIPFSTPSNAHPPLVMAYLALAWKIFGYAPVVTRLAMLLVAAFALLGVFRLAQRVASNEVAVASTLCTALYSVFFMQSSLAQVDLATAGFTFWALLAYIEDRRAATVIWFSLAVLTKETAILAPAALLAWECIVFCGAAISPAFAKACRPGHENARSLWQSSLLLIPAIPLALWYAYHRLRTGFIFGNPEYFRYNVQATMHPLRMLLAFLMRLWQIFGYMNLYPLTLATLFAMWIPPLHDRGQQRPRIAVPTQLAFLAVIATYVFAMAVIGGAVLARYMLPVVPLGIVICVSTLWRRVRIWPAAVALAVLAFVAAWFINPPYGFSLEDNLAYRDYIVLHQHAETFLEARYPMARVLTAWPASGEITQPTLGYITRPMRVVQIEDFTAEQLISANEVRSDYDIALVFSTKYDPPHALLENWQAWQKLKSEYFGYHRDLPPQVAARILGGTLVFSEFRQNQWAGVIEIKKDDAQEAHLSF